ncbi:MAG: LPXTG cell wall anchor domain-containing protein [Gemmataceae bacterium]
MDWINENFWTFMFIMIVLLAALVGLLLFLRNKRSEE